MKNALVKSLVLIFLGSIFMLSCNAEYYDESSENSTSTLRSLESTMSGTSNSSVGIYAKRDSCCVTFKIIYHGDINSIKKEIISVSTPKGDVNIEANSIKWEFKNEFYYGHITECLESPGEICITFLGETVCSQVTCSNPPAGTCVYYVCWNQIGDCKLKNWSYYVNGIDSVHILEPNHPEGYFQLEHHWPEFLDTLYSNFPFGAGGVYFNTENDDIETCLKGIDRAPGMFFTVPPGVDFKFGFEGDDCVNSLNRFCY